MQSQPLNPMTPSYPFDDEEQESQIPPWALQSKVTEESKLWVHQPWPSFKPSLPGENFGFKVPSTYGTQSINSYSSSVPSSRSPSIFSPPTSHTGSTTSTSYMPSECRSNNGTQDNLEGSQLAPPRQTSQLCMLAAANLLVDPPPCKSCMAHPSSQPLFGTFEDQAPACDDLYSPPLWPVGLCQTHTFSQLPSTICASHMMFATDDGFGVDADVGGINETSPSEDEHLAQSIVHGESCWNSWSLQYHFPLYLVWTRQTFLT